MGGAAGESFVRLHAPAGPDRAATLARRLGPLRLRPGLLALERGDEVWLRGPQDDADLERALRAIPGAARFRQEAGGALVPVGARLPVGPPPSGAWAPLLGWLEPVAPGAPAAPGEAPRAVALRLVRGAPPAVRRSRDDDGALVAVGLAGARADDDPTWPEPELLACAAADLVAWAALAPALRLATLELAAPSASSAGPGARVLVRGRPLPPIAGERWLVSEGVAAPVGFVVEPDLGGAALRALLGLAPDELALLVAGSAGALEVERVPAEAFVPLTRGAARAALEGEPGGRKRGASARRASESEGEPGGRKRGTSARGTSEFEGDA